MAKHRAGRIADRWLLTVIGVLAVIGLVLAGAYVLRDKPPSDGDDIVAAPTPCSRSVRVVTATSFAPVLSAAAARLEADDACVKLDVTIADGRAAVQRVADVDADLWIPDDGSWAGSAGSLALAQAPAADAGSVLATSPFYLVADRDTSARLQQAGAGWLGLARLVDGSGTTTRMVVRDPVRSGDGMVAAGAVAEAVWLDKDMDASALWLARAKAATRIVTDDRPALPAGPGEVGIVPEYALLPSLDAAGRDLTAVPGTDHTAMLRYTWLPMAAAANDPVRAAALKRVHSELTGPAASTYLKAATLRVPGATDAPADGDSRLPGPTAAPFEVLKPHHVDHVFATWYAADRRTNLLVVVDVSGSMAAKTPGSNTSRIDLVRQGSRSLGGLLPDDSRMGLWEFGSELDGKRDYRQLMAMAALDDGQRRSLTRAVDKLTARKTGTGLYDTVLAAYKSARDAYRPGVPNQVLVFTDGRNESDADSPTVAEFTDQLRRTADPKRPVHLSVVTFGKESDAKVVADAVKPVDGYVDVLTDADEVAAVFIHVAAGGLHH
jgi:hypothetical protein